MKKPIAIFFTLLLLISNVGLTLATHYCGGDAVKSEVMVGHQHLDCGMPDMDQERTNGLSYNTTCCENDYQTFIVEDDYHLAANILIAGNFIIPFVYTFMGLSFSSDNDEPQYNNYSPPLLLQDIPLLNQVFLI